MANLSIVEKRTVDLIASSWEHLSVPIPAFLRIWPCKNPPSISITRLIDTASCLSQAVYFRLTHVPFLWHWRIPGMVGLTDSLMVPSEIEGEHFPPPGISLASNYSSHLFKYYTLSIVHFFSFP